MKESSSVDAMISAAKSGDTTSLELLLLRYYRQLLIHIKSQFSESDLMRGEAEDIVQQTHQQVFNGIDGFRGSTAREFCGWLYRICNNVLMDARRSQNSAKRSGHRTRLRLGSSSESSMCILWSDLSSDASTPSKIAISREEKEQLEHALRQLTTEEFEMIQMRYLEEKSSAEIAKTVGVSRSTVVRKCEATMIRMRQLVDFSSCSQ